MTRRTFLEAAGLLSAGAATCLCAQQQRNIKRKTEHIILFTSDGVRWQDLFTGIDPTLMNQKRAGMDDAAPLEKQLWRTTPDERREALMPFFWRTLAPRGVVLGNLAKGSSMQVSNQYRVSYPAYSEILTGRTQDSVIRGNDPIQNPDPSFLQFLKNRRHLQPEQLAVFASWDNFHFSATSQPGDIIINAGYEPLRQVEDIEVRQANRLQSEARFVSDSARHDAFTFNFAMKYLNKMQPEHLFISFDETDDWAHWRRYDRVLESLQYFDQALNELWTYLQSSPKYSGKTTLVITTDHGRGATLEDFSDHGSKVAGCEQIWAAFVGPDTPHQGEAINAPGCLQRDIAPTILELLGIDYRDYAGVAGKPIRMALI